MMKLLIATTNQGKVRELRALVEGFELEIVGLEALEGCPEAAETGATFEENALQKARHYHGFSGLLTLADDSGLEVEALGGRPGVHSARYGGEGLGSAERNERLLEEMRGLRPGERGARFVCVLALVGKDRAATFRATSSGEIAMVAGGEGGFGYDPIFIDPETGKRYAELAAADKARRSHRGRAMLMLREYLDRWLGGPKSS